ncbi:hypothetical protein SERLA73DRAFT_70033 [Serpula lacrymans var. lacrymans S7.3]|uniref:Uncharacterized protein n=1 Tax=Serpula lacrymans var. lacrymans (strain S7.3) TaxID=936435 RepID=F8PLP8_SERL3|nr:hypothetical protein SERLA73DRAFT_70033 [Serpula lacrymans var. lacrymans S7.3]
MEFPDNGTDNLNSNSSTSHSPTPAAPTTEQSASQFHCSSQREEFLKPPADITPLLALAYTSQDEWFDEKVAAEQQYWRCMMQLQIYKADLIAVVQGCHQADEDIQGL